MEYNDGVLSIERELLYVSDLSSIQHKNPLKNPNPDMLVFDLSQTTSTRLIGGFEFNSGVKSTKESNL